MSPPNKRGKTENKHDFRDELQNWWSWGYSQGGRGTILRGEQVHFPAFILLSLPYCSDISSSSEIVLLFNKKV